jgi:hypothetical protein
VSRLRLAVNSDLGDPLALWLLLFRAAGDDDDQRRGRNNPIVHVNLPCGQR